MKKNLILAVLAATLFCGAHAYRTREEKRAMRAHVLGLTQTEAQKELNAARGFDNSEDYAKGLKALAEKELGDYSAKVSTKDKKDKKDKTAKKVGNSAFDAMTASSDADEELADDVGTEDEVEEEDTDADTTDSPDQEDEEADQKSATSSNKSDSNAAESEGKKNPMSGMSTMQDS